MLKRMASLLVERISRIRSRRRQKAAVFLALVLYDTTVGFVAGLATWGLVRWLAVPHQLALVPLLLFTAFGIAAGIHEGFALAKAMRND